jgi:acetylglutamate kinase
VTALAGHGLSVLKLGGELIESGARAAALAPAVAGLAADGPLLVVHGGGKEIDAECVRRGIPKQAVDGLRVTGPDTLDAVVAVLAGTVNTRLVAALVAAGVPAVGLTGADAACVPVVRSAPHRAVDGRTVDLGLVGEPGGDGEPRLLTGLLALGYVPVVACLAADAAGQVHNVNADTLAGHLAAVLGARRLVVAGATAGVLDEQGRTLPELTAAGIDALVRSGTASAGMVAKLAACRRALDRGVAEVAIVDGREPASLLALRGTRLVHRK